MKSPHDFMVGIAKSSLGYHDVPEVEQETKTYRDAFNAVVRGEDCDFFFSENDPFSFYSVEQEIALLQAVRRARSLMAVTDDQRWRIVDQELTRQAHRYAEAKAREAGEL